MVSSYHAHLAAEMDALFRARVRIHQICIAHIAEELFMKCAASVARSTTCCM
jgi:hypothetical protein